MGHILGGGCVAGGSIGLHEGLSSLRLGYWGWGGSLGTLQSELQRMIISWLCFCRPFEQEKMDRPNK